MISHNIGIISPSALTMHGPNGQVRSRVFPRKGMETEKVKKKNRIMRRK